MTKPTCSIAILLDQRLSSWQQASSLQVKTARQLALPTTGQNDTHHYDYLLVFHNNGWELQPTNRKGHGPIRVDFSSPAAHYRRRNNHTELIVKAIGGLKHTGLSVLDATAGLGNDSFVLASRGYHVLMMERCEPIGHLLSDGLQRGLSSQDSQLKALLGRLTFRAGDSYHYLKAISDADKPDIVYIDPMFPSTPKTALAKKTMQACQAIVGNDADSEHLLAVALQKARCRVVVKRPFKSLHLANKKPSFSVLGKLLRFDVYLL